MFWSSPVLKGNHPRTQLPPSSPTIAASTATILHGVPQQHINVCEGYDYRFEIGTLPSTSPPQPTPPASSPSNHLPALVSSPPVVSASDESTHILLLLLTSLVHRLNDCWETPFRGRLKMSLTNLYFTLRLFRRMRIFNLPIV
jgi:hypothetical protein